MKIVLHAFGDKLTGVMEVPEETGNTFSLVMIQPIQYYSTSFKIGSPLMEKPIEKRCKFEWTGKVYLEENHPYNHGRIYQLVGIEDF
jgi:hypothetical protein